LAAAQAIFLAEMSEIAADRGIATRFAYANLVFEPVDATIPGAKPAALECPKRRVYALSSPDSNNRR